MQRKRVVNCFRSLYLWVDLQLSNIKVKLLQSCELLSFFVPLGWFTAFCLSGHQPIALWIAFVLCTFGLIYSQRIISDGHVEVVNCFRSLYLWVDLQRKQFDGVALIVVNCFRSLYLWVDLQHSHDTPKVVVSCELLSFFVPLGWFTASRGGRVAGQRCELLSFFVPLGWFTAILT